MSKVNSVLLIDDDSINNHINEKLIKKLKFSNEILVAVNGSQALQLVEERRSNCPKLIFLDLNMPAIDGFEFLETFQKMEIQDKNEVVIVILTTSKNISDMERIKQYGNYEVMNKPLKEEALMNIVSKYF